METFTLRSIFTAVAHPKELLLVISYLAVLPKDIEQKVMIFVEVWFIPKGAGGCIIQRAETNI